MPSGEPVRWRTPTCALVQHYLCAGAHPSYLIMYVLMYL